MIESTWREQWEKTNENFCLLWDAYKKLILENDELRGRLIACGLELPTHTKDFSTSTSSLDNAASTADAGNLKPSGI